jgi:hypothetical protein
MGFPVFYCLDGFGVKNSVVDPTFCFDANRGPDRNLTPTSTHVGKSGEQV